MHGIVWVNGLLVTVADLLRRGVMSPRIVACPLRMSGRCTPYYRRPTASTSCTHLMPTICCVWPVTYAFNALPAHVPGEAMMGLMSSVLRMHGYVGGREPLNTWRLRSPLVSGGRSRDTGHVATLEPSCAGAGLGPGDMW
jgi:hypothetical protein